MSDEPRPDEPDRVIIRDRRKIDRREGERRDGERREGERRADEPGATDGGSQAPEPGADEPQSADAALLTERTADLQRLQAEYANYRKRADRDRLAAGEVAVGRVLAELLPVLDDIERARTHGDLTGGLKAIADHLEVVFGKLGLQAFGQDGDPFDPTIHEAVLHNESEDVSAPTCTTVMRKGYRHGERLLRAAMVGVSDPASPPAPEVSDDEVDEPSSEESAD
ncbi:MAG: nucleotide exchange factor GrpE [Jatrophihabitantaceae bacterium]